MAKGDIKYLFDEAAAIQGRLKKKRRKLNHKEVARIFSKLMFQGKVNSAMNFLDTNAEKGGVLQLSPEVMTKLRKLQLDPKSAKQSIL